MEKKYFKIFLVVGFIFLTLTAKSDDAPSAAFKLKRGVGACSNLPTEADNFECKAIGWPDQNARVDIVKQEFVNKYGRTVRWGLFDYYYYFHGTKKCEPHKAMIVEHLTSRKDMDELWQKLGNDSDCIRKGQGWIQTRNIEVWNGTGKSEVETAVPSGPAEFQVTLKKAKEARVQPQAVPAAAPAPSPASAPSPSAEKAKPTAHAVTKPTRTVAKIHEKEKYVDEDPITSAPISAPKESSGLLTTEPAKNYQKEYLPKEFF